MLRGHMSCVFCKETIHNDKELSSTDKHKYIHNDGHGDSYCNLVKPPMKNLKNVLKHIIKYFIICFKQVSFFYSRINNPISMLH